MSTMGQHRGRIVQRLNNQAVYKWVVVGLLWTVGCLNYVDRQAIFSVFPLLKKDLAMSDVELAMLGSVFLWIYGFSSPLAGYLGDRFSRKAVILWSLAIFSALTFATGLAQSGWQLISLRGCIGISEALYIPTALALISDYHPDTTRATAIAIHQTSLLTGGIIGGVFAGYMGEHFGWRWAFLPLGAAGLLLAVVLVPSLRETVKGATDLSASQKLNPVHTESITKTIRTVLATPSVVCIMFSGAAMSISGWVVMTWMPVYLYDRFHLSLTRSGFDATFYFLMASVVGMLVGSVLGDRWASRNRKGRMLLQSIGLLGTFLGLLSIGFAQAVPFLLTALVLTGVGRGIWDCNNMPIFCDVILPSARSSAYGVFNLANMLGGGGGVLLAGALRQYLSIGDSLAIFSVPVFMSFCITLFAVFKFLPRDMAKMRQNLASW